MSEPAHLIPWFPPVTRRHPHSFTLFHFRSLSSIFGTLCQSHQVTSIVWSSLSSQHRHSLSTVESALNCWRFLRCGRWFAITMIRKKGARVDNGDHPTSADRHRLSEEETALVSSSCFTLLWSSCASAATTLSASLQCATV